MILTASSLCLADIKLLPDNSNAVLPSACFLLLVRFLGACFNLSGFAGTYGYPLVMLCPLLWTLASVGYVLSGLVDTYLLSLYALLALAFNLSGLVDICFLSLSDFAGAYAREFWWLITDGFLLFHK